MLFLKLLEAVIVFGSVFLLALIYLNIQAPASLAPGFDWNEKQYRLMATQFRAGETITADAPEVYRIGTPFIASILPFDNISDAFFFLEMASALLAVMLLYFWLRLHLQSMILPMLFVGLTVTTLWGPIRATTFHIHGIEGSLPIRLTPMTATCWVPPLSRVKLGIGWSRGAARDAEQ